VNDLDTQPGIGRALAAELRAVGIRDLAALRELGPAAAAERLAELGLRDVTRAQRKLEEALGEPAAHEPARAPLPVLGVETVEIPVGDLDAALRHYADALGLEVTARTATPASALLAAGGAILLLREERTLAEGATSPASVRIRLAVSDVSAVAHRLRAAGLETVSDGRVLELADRWGSVLGFVETLDAAGSPGTRARMS
jgi:catechol 2,3-dioxygenase-like lactoylglutathione lyase family enzyme